MEKGSISVSWCWRTVHLLRYKEQQPPRLPYQSIRSISSLVPSTIHSCQQSPFLAPLFVSMAMIYTSLSSTIVAIKRVLSSVFFYCSRSSALLYALWFCVLLPASQGHPSIVSKEHLTMGRQQSGRYNRHTWFFDDSSPTLCEYLFVDCSCRFEGSQDQWTARYIVSPRRHLVVKNPWVLFVRNDIIGYLPTTSGNEPVCSSEFTPETMKLTTYYHLVWFLFIVTHSIEYKQFKPANLQFLFQTEWYFLCMFIRYWSLISIRIRILRIFLLLIGKS